MYFVTLFINIDIYQETYIYFMFLINTYINEQLHKNIIKTIGDKYQNINLNLK